MSSQALAAGVVAPCAQARTVRAFFFVTAPADPGLLPRLIEPVAKLGAVPSRVHASRESGDGSELSVDLRLAGVISETVASSSSRSPLSEAKRIEPEASVTSIASSSESS